jgi:transcriptional regulator with XRE-family HTH domain
MTAKKTRKRDSTIGKSSLQKERDKRNAKIRKMYERDPQPTQTAIADRFGVSLGTVARALAPRPPKGETKPKNPHAVEIGKRIQVQRELLRMSRDDLAAQLKTGAGNPMGYQQIAHWEQGSAGIPGPRSRQELAEVLETTPSFLLSGEVHDPQAADRLALIERKVDALISIQGLGDLVEAKVREIRRREDRREAGPSAAQREDAMAEIEQKAPQRARRSRATQKKRASG